MPRQVTSKSNAMYRRKVMLFSAALTSVVASGCAATPSGEAPIDFRRASDNWEPTARPATVRTTPPVSKTKARPTQANNERGEAIAVMEGDTLYAISERYRVALRALIETNMLAPPFALEPGQALYLPPPNIHAVEPGETLYSISRRYNVDTRSLALMNGLPKPWTIFPGQPIRLPALARDTNAAPIVQKASVKSRPASSGQTVGKPSSTQTFVRPLPQLDGFAWPAAGEMIRTFGKSADGQRSDGVNIAAESGSPFHAAAAGEVVYAGAELAGFGKLLLIRHDQGWITAYAHADALLVREGDGVTKGQEIGRIGETGSVETPQLHFQLRKGEEAVDPTAHIQQPGLG